MEPSYFEAPLFNRGYYRTRDPNEPIKLHEGACVLQQTGSTWKGASSIALKWLPQRRIEFSMITNRKIEPDVGALAEVLFRKSGITCKCIIVSAGRRGSFTSITGHVTKRVEIKKEGDIDSLSMHLANFPKFQGNLISDHDGHTWLGRLTLEGNAWIMDIDQVDPTFWQELAEGTGYGITHVGRLRRKDDQPFDPDVAKTLTDRICWLSTFIRGAWCRPVLSVGTNADEVTWEMWDAGPVDAARQNDSWFPRKHTDGLDTLFDDFTRGSLTEPWNENLQRAIHFFVVANSEKSELGLVIAQAVLESLAWYDVVEVGRRCSKTEFNGYKASRRIRRLLKDLQIPVKIPACLSNLADLGVDRNWDDGPHAITDLRNGVVHANKGEDTFGSPVNARWEALELTLWYVELALLRLLKYDDVYLNRLSAFARKNEIVSVPWVS